MHYVDSGIYYNSSSATTISGLTHLEGETVRVLANGAKDNDATVSSGQITITKASTKVHAGLGFDGFVTTLDLPNGPQGILVGNRKDTQNCSKAFRHNGTTVWTIRSRT